MATTYTLISSNTVSGSTTTSVSFSSIPSTYTDLVLSISGRTDSANVEDGVNLRFNSNSATNYSETFIYGNGSTASSSRDSNQTYGYVYYSLDGADATASTFGNLEIYIPSYTVSQNKPISSFGVAESNATAVRMSAGAILWRNTATISSIQITPLSGSNFSANSTFYLYGIKNS